MKFELTEEQKEVQRTAREFAKKEILPLARKIDEEEYFPKEIIKKLAEMGFMGMMVPEKYGGAGFDTISYVLAMEEISAACASTGVIMSVNNSLVCDPLMRYGTEEQKMKYLVPLAKGELLGCFCLSEPDCGSDAAGLRTTARKEGNEYILEGTKNFVTNGPQADIAIVFATIDRNLRHKGICAFILEKDMKGYIISKVEKKLGIRGSGTAQIILDGVRVPEENLLGQVGEGFKVAMTTLDGGRIGIASQALGIARAAFEEAVKYSKERKAFGQNICEFELVQEMIAEMGTRIDAARLLTLRAAYLKDKKMKFTKEAAMAKLFASETAMWVTTKAIQIFGGYGYITDNTVERHFRDAKITEIYEGTSEIQKIVIATNILKEFE
jgi:butyryl-CoA dehydrogenase